MLQKLAFAPLGRWLLRLFTQGNALGLFFLPLHGVSGLAFAWLVPVIASKNCRLFLRTGEEILCKGAR